MNEHWHLVRSLIDPLVLRGTSSLVVTTTIVVILVIVVPKVLLVWIVLSLLLLLIWILLVSRDESRRLTCGKVRTGGLINATTTATIRCICVSRSSCFGPEHDEKTLTYTGNPDGIYYAFALS